MQKHPAQRSSLIMLCLDSGWLQRTFLDFSRVVACVLVAAWRRHFVCRGYSYFLFFLEVFFAIFLVAALADFFAFFAFLAMSSSVKNRFKE